MIDLCSENFALLLFQSAFFRIDVQSDRWPSWKNGSFPGGWQQSIIISVYLNHTEKPNFKKVTPRNYSQHDPCTLSHSGEAFSAFSYCHHLSWSGSCLLPSIHCLVQLVLGSTSTEHWLCVKIHPVTCALIHHQTSHFFLCCSCCWCCCQCCFCFW